MKGYDDKGFRWAPRSWAWFSAVRAAAPALVVLAVGCQGKPAAPKAAVAPVNSPEAAQKPGAARAAAVAQAADAPAAELPATATPAAAVAVVRRAVAQVPAAAAVAGVRLGERWGAVWRADGSWQARAFDAAGRTVWQAPAVDAPKGPIDALLACGAAGKVWVAPAGGSQLACLQGSTRGMAKSLPAPIIGLVGQGDGSAIAVLSAAEGKLQMARLRDDFSPLWQVDVALPGAVTAVTSTLRDDPVLLGRSANSAGAMRWFAARVRRDDGTLAWTSDLPAAAMPPDAELIAQSPTPGGFLIVAVTAKAPQNWTAVAIDANGRLEWSRPLERRAPRISAAAAAQGSWLAQTRSGQLLLQRLDGTGKPAEALSAFALDLEDPLALGSDGAAAWAVSRAPHPTGRGTDVLFTRWELSEGLAAPTCEPGPCEATRRDGERCARTSLGDGSACGSEASCATGRCVRRVP